MPELTVAAGLARGLIEVAISKGATEEALLARAGLPREQLDDQDNRIPFPRYVALMRAGKELCGDPALGLHFGELNDLARVSVVGLIGYASDTMLEAMQQMNRYGRLVIEFDGGPIGLAALRALSLRNPPSPAWCAGRTASASGRW